MKRTFLLALSVLFCSLVCSQATIQGIVFEDLNNNGIKDRKEKGLEGVAVSNGRDVVLTDQNGNYNLQVGNDNIIFVIKPSGYKVPVNRNNQPSFYYIHKPQGSPRHFKFAGVQPTGATPKSVDFPLLPGDVEEEFTALVFGDPQPYTQQEVDYFYRGIVEELIGIKGISFGLSLGDLVGDDLSLHSHYISAVSRIGLPWYNVIGNHDINYEATADSLSDESFEANFGPANYSFNYGKAHFLILDDILYPDPRDGQGYWGGFRPEQMEFIKNDLQYVPKDRLIVLAFHIPFRNTEAAYRLSDRQAIFDMLKDFERVLVLSAHTHYQRNDLFTDADGWRGKHPLHEYNAGTTSGDWYSGLPNEQNVPSSTMRDGTPKGYAFLKVIGTEYSIDYKVAGKPAEYQIQIHAPKFLRANFRTSARIYANFFMGRKDSKVEYRINGGQWQPMTYTEDEDPLYVGKLYEWDTSDKMIPYRRPSHPVISTHLWRAPAPANMPPGKYTIEVRATDMFGKQHFATHVITIE
jgi:hypothetical protein